MMPPVNLLSLQDCVFDRGIGEIIKLIFLQRNLWRTNLVGFSANLTNDQRLWLDEIDGFEHGGITLGFYLANATFLFLGMK